MSDSLRGGSSTSLVPSSPAAHRGAAKAAYPRRSPQAAVARVNPAHVSLADACSELLRRAALPGNALEAYAEQLVREGESVDWVCHELIPAVARRLGHEWEEDSSSFVDVTVVVCRLEQLVSRLHQEAATEAALAAGWVGRALVGPVPGEQHTLGVMLVAEALRKDGWDVLLTPLDAEQVVLLQQVSHEWFDVIALSVSSERLVRRVPALLRSLRRSARNPDMRILLGGRPFCEQHDLAETFGADGTASDSARAVALARMFRPEPKHRTEAVDVAG